MLRGNEGYKREVVCMFAEESQVNVHLHNSADQTGDLQEGNRPSHSKGIRLHTTECILPLKRPLFSLGALSIKGTMLVVCALEYDLQCCGSRGSVH